MTRNESTTNTAPAPADALQRIEQKLLQGGAALPVPLNANGVEHGLSIALMLVREEIAALAAAQQPATGAAEVAHLRAELQQIAQMGGRAGEMAALALSTSREAVADRAQQPATALPGLPLPAVRDERHGELHTSLTLQQHAVRYAHACLAAAGAPALPGGWRCWADAEHAHITRDGLHITLTRDSSDAVVRGAAEFVAACAAAQQPAETSLAVVERPGCIPVAELRRYFEASVAQTPSFAARFPLTPVADSVFGRYAHGDTNAMWLGFATGMRCAERVEKAVVREVRQRTSRYERDGMPTPFSSGFDLACEEIAYRLEQQAAAPSGTAGTTGASQ